MSGTFLGFDFGTKSIGVAVGQRITATARPLPALKAQDGKPDWNIIEKLLKEWQPEAVIVGLPLNMDGTEGPRAAKTRKLAGILGNILPQPIELWDERRSTVSAAGILSENGTYGKKRKQVLDAVAATVILEGYLAFRENKRKREEQGG